MKSKLWDVLETLLHYLIFNVLNIKLSDTQWKGLLKFVKFGIVGLSNTIISYLIYLAAFLSLQKLQLFPSVDYLIAQFIGFVLSVLWSFYWNNKYVFAKDKNEKRSTFQAILKTYVSYAFTGLFLNSLLSILWVEVLQISKIIAPFINLLISVPLNFVMNKFWAFKDKK